MSFSRCRLGFLLVLLASGLAALEVSPASALNTATKISQGGNSGCAITSAKKLECWGQNTYGQVGIGNDLSDQLQPVTVPGLSNVKSVSVGDYTACAIVKGGGLKCWGANGNGQVGDGTSGNSRLRPTQVIGMTSGVRSVSVGFYHVCALLSTGKVKCWGDNAQGGIGNGTSGNEYHHPVLVSGIKNVTQISAGYGYSCATVSGAVGRAKCWGWNDAGKLGDNSIIDRDEPTQVTGLTSGVKSVNAGYTTTCALLEGGDLKCWGLNTYGEVGNGTSGNEFHLPVQVLGMTSGVTSYDTDFGFTCAVQNGSAKCWGHGASHQLGNGVASDQTLPFLVAGLSSGVMRVDIGSYTGCALLSGGTEKCWGYNGDGEVGNGTNTTPVPTPVTVLT